MDGGNPPSGEQLRVAAGQIDAVGGNAAVFPHTVLVQQGGGGLAVLFDALLML